MYLVLTAMLALNVSPQVLQAFVRMEESFQQSISIVRSNNTKSYEEFKQAASNEPEKVGPWLKKATQVRDETKKLYDVIDSLKVRIVSASEGTDSPALRGKGTIQADTLSNIGDTNTGTRILVGTEESKGDAYKLQEDISNYRNILLSLLEDDETKDSGIRNSITGLLQTEKAEIKTVGSSQDWAQSLFYNSPLISNIALLSKIQLDVLSCESAMLNHLFVKIGQDDFKFSAVIPIIKPNSEYIVSGGEYRAEIFLAAYDSNTASTAVIDGRSYTSVDGKIVYTAQTSGVGPKAASGTIEYMGPDGPVTEAIRLPYQVIKPTATVSPSKMNVLYSGIPNPLDISVGAGVPADKIRAEVKGGSALSRQGDFFMVTPAAGSKAYNIVVSAEIDGKWQHMGTAEFRVKPVPPPTAIVDGVQGKSTTKGALASSQGLRAVPPADFDFDAKFTITSFMVSVVNNEGYVTDEPSNGAYFNEKHRRMFNSMRNNSQVTITNIKANGPSGSMDLPDLVIRVK